MTATDLYREHFDLGDECAAERQSYYRPPYDGAAVEHYTELLRRVDGVIFCFPPLVVRHAGDAQGYFDRVWVLGVAFTHDLAGAARLSRCCRTSKSSAS